MGNRLSRITTRTGDQGQTGLGDGRRLSKADLRIHCLGEVDELNSWIGLLRAELPNQDELQAVLNQIQHDLFDMGGELAVPGFNAFNPRALTELETAQEQLAHNLPALKEFVLPAGNRQTAQAHLARTVCRRAERHLVELAAVEEINPLLLAYLNRLSDTLFIMARGLARRDGGQEVLWQNRYTHTSPV